MSRWKKCCGYCTIRDKTVIPQMKYCHIWEVLLKVTCDTRPFPDLGEPRCRWIARLAHSRDPVHHASSSPPSVKIGGGRNVKAPQANRTIRTEYPVFKSHWFHAQLVYYKPLFPLNRLICANKLTLVFGLK